MTPKQRENQARFKKVMAEAKKLRSKNKTLTQAQAVKQAWAIMYSKGGKSKKIGTINKKDTLKVFYVGFKNRKIREKIQAKTAKEAIKEYQNRLKPIYGNVSASWLIADKENKVGYKSDRTNILKYSTAFMRKYKAKGYSRKDAIKNANIDAAYAVGTTKDIKGNGYHKDTKSHNVNIRVVSGIGASMYSVRDNLEKEIQRAVYQLEILKGKKKAGLLNDPFDKKLLIRYPGYIQNLKKQLREQNKLITSNLR